MHSITLKCQNSSQYKCPSTSSTSQVQVQVQVCESAVFRQTLPQISSHTYRIMFYSYFQATLSFNHWQSCIYKKKQQQQINNANHRRSCYTPGITHSVKAGFQPDATHATQGAALRALRKIIRKHFACVACVALLDFRNARHARNAMHATQEAPGPCVKFNATDASVYACKINK